MLMLLGSRLCLFELVEHGLGGDVAGDLLQVGVGLGLDSHPVGDLRHQRDEPGDLVLGEQAQMQVEVRPVASETGTVIHVEPFTQPS
jgi:hypothetical protein